MLRAPGLDLTKVLLLGNSAVQTRNHVKELRQVEVADIDSIKSKSSTNNRRTDRPHCKYCGGSHKRGACPDYGQYCNNCRKSNHFTKVCQSRTVNDTKKVNSVDVNDSEF